MEERRPGIIVLLQRYLTRQRRRETNFEKRVRIYTYDSLLYIYQDKNNLQFQHIRSIQFKLFILVLVTSFDLLADITKHTIWMAKSQLLT